MPTSAQQVEQHIQRIIIALEELIAHSELGAEKITLFESALGRLTASGVGRFHNLKQGLGDFVDVFEDAQREIGKTEEKINELTGSVRALRETGRLQTGFTGKTYEFGSAEIDDVEERMQKAGRTAGLTEDRMKRLSEVVTDLFEREVVEGGLVRALGKMLKDGELLEQEFKDLRRAAKLFLSDVSYVDKQLALRRDVDTGLGREGEKEQEPNIGEFIETQQFMEALGRGMGGLEGAKRQIATLRVELDKMGFSLTDVDDVFKDSSRSLVRWTATIKRTGEPTQRGVVVTNEWAQALKSTQKQLRTFTGAIVRDIAEVTKWAIAVAVVYAPLRRLQQTMEEMVTIEAKLADAQVALGTSAANLTIVWEQSADIARQLGVSVEGVIEGYILATRATANIAEPAERSAATVAVLKDSMILAKLAGIDQAIAMDTLVGALRQLNLPLTEGEELLDKWVAVSKAANVSLHTLAESFAITATAAKNVGVNMDYLNGIIAAVAEVTTLSATESGNAVRAFISGFQRDQSERELAKFGIAVKTVNGELRSFIDVIEEIVERKEVGLISDAELAKISEVIGGGARRGPQVNAFLSNYARVQELAAISSRANGDAADALAIKMDTLQTAAQNLNNAFTELSRALGKDGGFLDMMSGGTRLITNLVDLFTGLVKVLGKATPALVGLTVAWAAFHQATQEGAGGRLATYLGKDLDKTLIGAILNKIPGAGADEEAYSGVLPGTARPETLGSFGQQFFQRGAPQALIGGAAIGGLAALPTLMQQDKGTEEYGKAGASIAGGIAGTLIAGPVGGIIGATIGQAFVNQLETDATAIQAVMKMVASGAFKAATTEQEWIDLPAEQLTNEINEILNAALAQEAGISRFEQDLFGGTTASIMGLGYEKPIEKYLGARPGTVSAEDQARILEREMLGAIAGEEPQIDAPKFMKDKLTALAEIGANDPEMRRVAQSIVAALDSAIVAEAGVSDIDVGAFTLRLLGVSEEYGPIAAGLLEKQRSDLLREVAAGETGVRALTELLNIGDVEQVISTVVAAMGDAASSTEAYERVANTMIDATQQERDIFQALAGEIADLIDIQAELAEGTEDYAIRREHANVSDQIAIKQQQLLQYEEVAREGQIAREYELPSIIGVSPDATKAQLNEAVRLARNASNDMLDSLDLLGPERDKIIAGWGELAVQNVETYKIGMQGITGVNADIFKDYLEQLDLLADQSQMAFQQLDIPASELPQLFGNYAYYQQLLEPTGLLDDQELVDTVLLTSDNQVHETRAMSLLLNLAMQDLININEQQLEGIFNIPEGVTAQIPFTGKLYFSDQPIPDATGGNLLKNLGPKMDSIDHGVDEAATTAHQDALSTIEVLNLMLAAGQGSPEFLDKMEQVVRDLGGEPAERGEMGRPVSGPEGQFIPDPLSEEAVQRLTERALELGLNTFGGLIESQQQVVREGENPELRLVDRFAEQQDAINRTNPELRLHQRFQGLSPEDILNALPQSIPVTIQTKIINPVTVYIDGMQVQKALEERNYEDLESAVRRTGATGYILTH